MASNYLINAPLLNLSKQDYWTSGIGPNYDFFSTQISTLYPDIQTSSSDVITIGGGVTATGGTSSWYDKWGNNFVNAGVTGILTGLSALSGLFSGSNIYKYYKQQEDLYIQQGLEQARRLQLKGDIALRNIEVANTIKQGRNELAVSAGAGGRLSGSFLDVLSQNNTYNNMDERTQAIETLWEVSDARAQGYINAARVAGHSMNYAYSRRNSALSGLTGMIKAASTDLLSDLETYRQEEYQANRETIRRQSANAAARLTYGDDFSQLGDLGSWSDPDNSEIGSFRNSPSLLRIRY